MKKMCKIKLSGSVRLGWLFQIVGRVGDGKDEEYNNIIILNNS